MKLLKAMIEKIIREELNLNESYDGFGDAIPQSVTAAFKSAGPDEIATILDDMFEENADLYLDDWWSSAFKTIVSSRTDVSSLKDFRDKIEDNLYAIQKNRKKLQIDQSPWKSELRALSWAFTSEVGPKDVPYIIWQPRKSKGRIIAIKLKDSNHRLGHTVTSLEEYYAKQHDTTLDRVIECLASLGAKMVSRGF